MKPKTPKNPCPCDPSREYAACCQPLHEGAAAPNAEALMRSRYSAYVLHLPDYLYATWAEENHPATLERDALKWIGLRIHRHEQTSANTALVEFSATFKVNGKAEKLREISQFRLEAERWVYVDGVVGDAVK